MVKISGKTKRTIVVLVTFLVMCGFLYGVIDLLFWGGSMVGDLRTKEKIIMLFFSFLLFYVALDHWYKPTGKGKATITALTILYAVLGIFFLFFFFVIALPIKVGESLPAILVAAVALVSLTLAYWCYQNEDDTKSPDQD